ncbi:YopX family protein [Bacillus sp. DTU_2020_1000418_1_SI_GHA_SEK_038]|uniref:YopX family protein n=1 Tax=Bacillus sp. DTU_2020_1000418_1_SI_GHA_SEK_038 TaxID=3077585 RepID=UPI0028E892D3|nr:YopX family protein [Bacillus sp. DTU_2020_1000418_1_SI_GHA_SEK_038]WNS74269.1 YopX family protein [Bacillus sp. DTU_2020_1000418_1_SI_GHA_SEK_038]
MRELKFRAFNKRHKEMVYESDEWMVSDLNKENDRWTYAMQYTGLKDKEGKEIYEGDIVELGTKERFYVTWHDYKQEFTFRGYGGGYYPNTYRGATRYDKYGWKVIGNIHENKELLTEYPEER